MSFALGIAATVFSALDSVLVRLPRGIFGQNGVVIPDCVIEETSRDDMQITEHPVEVGTVIADHAFKKPREITLRWSWSNTGNYDTYMQDVFATLQSIQGPPPQLLSIYTGKSGYANMLIVSIGITTNSTSEYVLNAVMVCREVILVSTQAGTVAPQAIPQSTGPQSNRGNLSLSPTPSVAQVQFAQRAE